LINFVEEERLVRDKRAVGRFPINATNWCLKDAGIGIRRISGGNDHHRRLLQDLQELDAVHFGHLNIQDNKIGSLPV
jgi:predicted NodU family carbamoyl transferase